MSRLRWWRRSVGEPTAAASDRPPPIDGAPSVVVLTMARDEGPMLGVWVDHHARLVGTANVIVLDDCSSDGSTEGLACTVHRLPGFRGERFEGARMQLVSGLAQGLLAVYDYVVFVDADEFLVVDPAHGGLAELLLARGLPAAVGAVGINVVHLPHEAPLDLGRPVLEQRSFGVFAPLMCKPAVKRVPAPWVAASHGLKAPYAVDPDLFLVHLKFADRDRLLRMAALRNAQHRADGRARKSSWAAPAADLVAVLDGAVAKVDPASVPELDPRALDLAAVVHAEKGGVWRTQRQGQRGAVRSNPVLRLPAGLRGAF